jgi:hypothetical protein
MHTETIIRGEEAIREAIQEWRRFLIKSWREEPLRMVQAIPYDVNNFFHTIHFHNGWVGRLGYMGHEARYPMHWGCNLVSFRPNENEWQVPDRLAIGLYDFDPVEVGALPAIGRIEDTIPAIYDPVLLLLWHLTEYSCDSVAKGQPLSAAEVVERSEQLFIHETPAGALESGWVRLRGGWYPVEVFTIARERI